MLYHCVDLPFVRQCKKHNDYCTIFEEDTALNVRVGRYVQITIVKSQDLSFIGRRFINASVLHVMRYTDSANLVRMLPTSVVLLCWGILANSSLRNCLR